MMGREPENDRYVSARRGVPTAFEIGIQNSGIFFRSQIKDGIFAVNVGFIIRKICGDYA